MNVAKEDAIIISYGNVLFKIFTWHKLMLKIIVRKSK